MNVRFIDMIWVYLVTSNYNVLVITILYILLLGMFFANRLSVFIHLIR